MAKKKNSNKKDPNKKNDDIVINIPSESNNAKSDADTEKELRQIFEEQSRVRKNRKQEPTYIASEDEKEFDRDPLYAKALRLLPTHESPEILTAIEMVDNINFLCLMSASLSENMYRGHMNDEELDCMIAAFILSGAQNVNDIVNSFEENTLLYTKEFLQMMTAENKISFGDNSSKYEHYSKSARRMYAALAVSQLIAVETQLKDEGTLMASHEHIQSLGEILIRESCTNPEQVKAVDERMLEMGVENYNKISEKIDLESTLKTLNNGVITKDKKSGPSLPPISFGK